MANGFSGIFRALLFLSLLALSNLAAAQISDINSAINKAGRERMLSQRVAKLYLQIGQGIDVERSKMAMSASVSQFDRQLVELKNYAPTPVIRETYQKLEKSWIVYKDVLLGAAPSQSGARKVLDLSEDVMTLANQGASQLEAHAGSNAGRLVNLSGRQRMLSQRMAKYYHAANWGVGSAQMSSEIDRARKEFVAALQDLGAAPGNTPAIKDDLELIRQQWFFFDNALGAESIEKKQLALNVATTSERILETLDNVATLYERLPR
jgi:hypothetical protein